MRDTDPAVKKQMVERRLRKPLETLGITRLMSIVTIPMVLSEAGRRLGIRLNYSILGTDISTKALETADRAVYEEDAVKTKLSQPGSFAGISCGARAAERASTG